jgi:hypothetical protein
MARKILTPLQKNFIGLFAENKPLKTRFYLTGGTALANYYLYHRYSEDLDFFSLKQIDILELDVFIKKIKTALKITKSDFQQSFNRNIFFLHTKKGILKTEFTYFPFEQIEKPLKKDGIIIDSIVDIATNKTFTISQNPRSRDFIDLYCILQKYKKPSFQKLIRMARSKFDTQIDPLQLGTQLLKSKYMHDLPRMVQKIDQRKWRAFFVNQAKLLSKEIFK